MGKKYRNISIEYVNSPKHLETARRLLLADGMLNGHYMVLGSDVIINPIYFKKIAELFHTTPNILGVDTGAVDITPAPTHALIHTDNNKITYIEMTPTIGNQSSNLLRDMGLYYFHKNFWYVLRRNPNKNINIGDAINEGIKIDGNFIANKYLDRWYHFAYPENLDVSIQFNE